jgi:hypothetical protein
MLHLLLDDPTVAAAAPGRLVEIPASRSGFYGAGRARRLL